MSQDDHQEGPDDGHGQGEETTGMGPGGDTGGPGDAPSRQMSSEPIAEPGAGSAVGPETQAEPEGPPLPPFPKRILQVFINPGELMSALASRPAWAAALVLSAVLVATQTALIPWEVVESFQREAALQRGQAPPEIPENVAQIMRVATPIFAGVAVAIFTFLFAGIFTLIFSFVLGDEGKYRKYLAATAHANLIPAVVGLALVPLKISEQNPQFTLNLGSFFFFLPEGYPLRVLTMMDLSQLWAMLVIAAGAKAIDPRRSYGSAATILVGIAIALAMIFATFVPTV